MLASSADVDMARVLEAGRMSHQPRWQLSEVHVGGAQPERNQIAEGRASHCRARRGRAV